MNKDNLTQKAQRDLCHRIIDQLPSHSVWLAESALQNILYHDKTKPVKGKVELQ